MNTRKIIKFATITSLLLLSISLTACGKKDKVEKQKTESIAKASKDKDKKTSGDWSNSNSSNQSSNDTNNSETDNKNSDKATQNSDAQSQEKESEKSTYVPIEIVPEDKELMTQAVTAMFNSDGSSEKARAESLKPFMTDAAINQILPNALSGVVDANVSFRTAYNYISSEVAQPDTKGTYDVTVIYNEVIRDQTTKMATHFVFKISDGKITNAANVKTQPMNF